MIRRQHSTRGRIPTERLGIDVSGENVSPDIHQMSQLIDDL